MLPLHSLACSVKSNLFNIQDKQGSALMSYLYNPRAVGEGHDVALLPEES